MIRLDNPSENIQISDIEKFEKDEAINLPLEYKKFLLINNGGYPDRGCFNFSDGRDGSIVDVFYGISGNKIISLKSNMDEYKSRMPSEFIPIGEDPGGNRICLSLRSIDFGKIYFWDHELEADTDIGEIPSDENLTLISDNFSDFIESLYELNI